MISLGYKLKSNPRELYRVLCVEGGIEIHYSPKLYESAFTQQHFSEETLQSITQATRIEDGLAKTFVELPYISFPNTAHKKPNWGKAYHACNILSDMFALLAHHLDEEEFSISDKSQLMLIDCFAIESFASVVVAFNPSSYDVMQDIWQQGINFPSTRKAITECYVKLSTTKQREASRILRLDGTYRSYMSSTAYIRKGGVPHFTIPGNCACLGANPDEFCFDHALTPHNLDTPLQMLTMLVGVVTFWNNELIPVVHEKK